MTTKFQRHELPIAYSMIAAAKRVRPRRDGRHPYEQYFLLWTAFNNVYTTIAHRKGRRTRLIENDDGSIVTIANGNVNIPQVAIVSEREQIHLSLDEFDHDLKHALIIHKSTGYFVTRIPAWQGSKIETDAFGQRVNGVINVHHTSDSQYPVWSPIDIQVYEAYLENPDKDTRDLLARQVVDLLYTVRENYLHGGRRFDDANDITVVANALPMLELIVSYFTQ